MAEQEQNEQPEGKKQYPGRLDRYHQIQEARKMQENTPGDINALAALCIAEELAGLAYILDGIRYAARRR